MKKIFTLTELKNVLADTQIINPQSASALKGGDEGTVVDPYLTLKH